MANPVGNNARGQTSVTLGSHINTLMENHLERSQIMAETNEAVTALEQEFTRKLFQLGSNPNQAAFSEMKAELQRKKDELWAQNNKKLEELGLNK